MSHVTCHISHITYHISHITYHISHITYHISHITYHISHITYHMSHIKCHISHVTYHMSHITYHISHITYHISHITYHISHITYHISHITYHISHTTYHISHITYHISHITYHISYITLVTRKLYTIFRSPNVYTIRDDRGPFIRDINWRGWWKCYTGDTSQYHFKFAVPLPSWPKYLFPVEHAPNRRLSWYPMPGNSARRRACMVQLRIEVSTMLVSLYYSLQCMCACTCHTGSNKNGKMVTFCLIVFYILFRITLASPNIHRDWNLTGSSEVIVSQTCLK